MRPDLRLCCAIPLSRLPGDLGRFSDIGVGATALVLDPDGLPDRQVLATLRDLRARLPDATCLALGRVDHAMAASLDGVLLDREEMSPADARRLLGPSATIGLAIHRPSEADELYRLPVDFACVAPPDDAGLQLTEAFSRIAFRIRLAAPGTVVLGMGVGGPDVADRLMLASADGLLVRAAPEGEVSSALAALRARVDAALATRGHR